MTNLLLNPMHQRYGSWKGLSQQCNGTVWFVEGSWFQSLGIYIYNQSATSNGIKTLESLPPRDRHPPKRRHHTNWFLFIRKYWFALHNRLCHPHPLTVECRRPKIDRELIWKERQIKEQWTPGTSLVKDEAAETKMCREDYLQRSNFDSFRTCRQNISIRNENMCCWCFWDG